MRRNVSATFAISASRSLRRGARRRVSAPSQLADFHVIGNRERQFRGPRKEMAAPVRGHPISTRFQLMSRTTHAWFLINVRARVAKRRGDARAGESERDKSSISRALIPARKPLWWHSRSSEFNGTFQTMAAADLFEGSSVMRKQSRWKRGGSRKRRGDGDGVAGFKTVVVLTLSTVGLSNSFFRVFFINKMYKIHFHIFLARIFCRNEKEVFLFFESIIVVYLCILLKIWRSVRTPLNCAWIQPWLRTTDLRSEGKGAGKRLSEYRAAKVYRRSLYFLVLAPRRLFIRPLNSFISRYSVFLLRSTVGFFEYSATRWLLIL